MSWPNLKYSPGISLSVLEKPQELQEPLLGQLVY
jgi:hypothetical protein